MDSSAIQEIQKAFALEEANCKVIAQTNNVDSRGVAVLPNDMSITDLEQYRVHKRRYSGHFSTTMIEENTYYIKKNANETTALFIDSSDMEAVTIFDLGTIDKPLHGKHRSILKLSKTSDFSTLLNSNKERFNQVGFSDFIEDSNDLIKFYDADNKIIKTPAVVTAVRHVTSEQVSGRKDSQQNFSSEATTFEKTAIKDADNLPTFMDFTCSPYKGFNSRTILCRIAVLTSSQDPKFVYSIVNHEKIQEQLTEEFLTQVQSSLIDNGVDIATHIGTFSL